MQKAVNCTKGGGLKALQRTYVCLSSAVCLAVAVSAKRFSAISDVEVRSRRAKRSEVILEAEFRVVCFMLCTLPSWK